jgi:hypothetical protein
VTDTYSVHSCAIQLSHLCGVFLTAPPKHRQVKELHSHCDVHYLIHHFPNNTLKALYEEKMFNIPILLECSIQEIAYTSYQSYNAATLFTIEKYSCKAVVSCITSKVPPLRA